MPRSPKAPTLESPTLLLKRTPYGESSLVVHALTESGDRVQLIAKGAYRPKSRYAGVLDWFDTLRLGWVMPRKEGADLGILHVGSVEVRRRLITRSIAAYRGAQTMVELIDVCTRSSAAERGLYRLLEAGLDALNVEQPRVLELLSAFELHLLAELGLPPALRVCAVCGGEAPEVVVPGGTEPRAAFSAQLGGRLCPYHAEEAHRQGARVGTMPRRVLETAADWLERPFPVAGAASPLPRAGHEPSTLANDPPLAGLAERVLDFTGRFLDHHLETRPRSHARFLSAPDRNRRTAGPTSR